MTNRELKVNEPLPPTDVDLLQEALNALNQIPNTRLKGRYRNSYELAAEIGAFLRRPA